MHNCFFRMIPRSRIPRLISNRIYEALGRQGPDGLPPQPVSASFLSNIPVGEGLELSARQSGYQMYIQVKIKIKETSQVLDCTSHMVSTCRHM